MKKIGKWLYDELIAGKTWFDWCFLVLGLVCQTVVFFVTGKTPIYLVAGITGILSVYLCAQGKIAMYVFGIVNIVTYIGISYAQRLYGEVAINGFYFACQAFGIWNWAKHYRHKESGQESHLVTRKLTTPAMVIVIAATALGSLVTGYALGVYTNDSDPYFDAFTTIPAFAAEIMMVSGYAQHWYLWIFIDIGSIWMWLRAGNYSMAVLKTFWLLNCIYGLYHWNRNGEEGSRK